MQAFQAATFPFIILVFFSGSVYPFPKFVIAKICGRGIGLFDVLPSTHGVTALNKILTFGVAPSEMAYEFTAMILLSLLLYSSGVLLFSRKRFS